MFERFTRAARDVVVRAQEEAAALGHDGIGTEHLLLGVAAGAAGAASLGVDPAGLRAAVARQRRRGELDAAALATIGIDLDAVRSRSRRPSGRARSPGGAAAGAGAAPATCR